MKDFKITGSLIQAFVVCKRQAWLLSRNIVGNQINDFISTGKLIAEESYKKEKKEVLFSGGKIDVLKKVDENLVVIEVKKSSAKKDAAIMQLLFYLYSLQDKLGMVSGELRIPKEKKVIKVELTDENLEKLKKVLGEIKKTVLSDNIPHAIKKSYCSKCSFEEFCWA